MENKKEFRKKVLQLHYDISKGNSWNLVMRTVLAEKWGIENYNNEDLLGAIKYLEDKGYLSVVTNMEDQITDLGIDEVEKNFPSFNINQGPLKGIFIAARNIKNYGKITSEGEEASTQIITENYEGDGEVSAKFTKKSEECWYQKWWGILILGIIASAIVAAAFYFLWNFGYQKLEE